MSVKKPIVLCILDGWGIGDDNSPYNAIAKAKTPNYDRMLKEYPHSKLEAAGEAVGLPAGQIGNSEVGHMNIGAGRIIYQDLQRIINDVRDGGLKTNKPLQDLIAELKKTGGKCHLLGLISEGGVHSHQDQIAGIAKEVASHGIKVRIHAFLDGRDVAQKSAIEYITKFEKQISNSGDIKIATVGGRYYGMDRDKRWDRVEKAYNSMALGEGAKFDSALDGIESAYSEGLTDEFVVPFIINGIDGIMDDGDGLLIGNFRADRVRQIGEVLANKDFADFNRKKIVDFCGCVGLTEYSEHLNKFFTTMYPPQDIRNSLGEVLEAHNLTQLRMAETEKYAHVTFFLSGGREEPFKGEERILVASPKVATYDLQPEMSAFEVRDKLIGAIKSDKFDVIVVNFANPDMVGHTGIMEAGIKAAETIDGIVGEVEKAIKDVDGLMFITADHGNLEKMFDEKQNQPYTAHSTNLVPFILVGNDVSGYKLKDGKLSNISPTILDLLGVEKPKEMKEESVIVQIL